MRLFFSPANVRSWLGGAAALVSSHSQLISSRIVQMRNDPLTGSELKGRRKKEELTKIRGVGIFKTLRQDFEQLQNDDSTLHGREIRHHIDRYV